MKKYPRIILAMTAAVMLTSCSSVLDGKDAQSALNDSVQKSKTAEVQTDVIKIESETDPVPSSGAAETEAKVPSARSKPGETETPPLYPVTALQKVMYVTQPVHLRAGCTMKSDVLTTFATGRKVMVTGQSSNGWLRISYHGGEAYIYKKYLNGSKAAAKEASSVSPSGNTQPGQAGGNSSDAQKPASPEGDFSGIDDNIPIVEPLPATPSADGSSKAGSAAGPGI